VRYQPLASGSFCTMTCVGVSIVVVVVVWGGCPLGVRDLEGAGPTTQLLIMVKGGDARYTYARRHTYRTRSNRIVPVKTPGGRLVGHTITKQAHRPNCGDCGSPLNGIPARRPHDYRGMSKTSLRVNRAYGGSVCGTCVRSRIVRAFLEEEKKAVKSVLQQKKKAKTT
jgi:large subunit ribosomal protein L34e